jgi:lipopolysaccharide heptosyltransferase I
MRILLVKTSSLGDVIHNLPVVSDLRHSFPDASIDWCVEEAFADIARLHPAVDEVIPVAIRRWRKNLARLATWRDVRAFRARIASRAYDAVLDTQGLLKSALIARQASGRHCGYAAESAREPLAARFYDETFVIPAQRARGRTQPLAGRSRFRLSGRPGARLRYFGAGRSTAAGPARRSGGHPADGDQSRRQAVGRRANWCELGQRLAASAG